MLLLIGTANVVPCLIVDVVIPGAQGASLSATDAHKNRGLRIFCEEHEAGARTALIRNDHVAAGVMRVQASSLWHLHGFDATAEAVKHGGIQTTEGPRARQISYA